MRPVFQKPAAHYEPRGRLDPAGFERHVDFAVHPPPEALAPFIEHGWVIRWDVAQGVYNSEEVMHRPYVDAFVSAEHSGIQGTFRGKRTYPAAGSGRIIGLRFRPGAFHAFWNGQLSDLQDRIVGLQEAFLRADGAFVDDLLGRDDEGAIEALLALVGADLPATDETIEAINDIIAAIETDDSLQTVSAVASAFGRSERWLQQTFRDYLGIGLKWLLQRNRLLAAAAQIRDNPTPDWADIAYELGYSSQQHLITDFKTVLGSTPLQYKKRITRQDS